MTGKQVAQPAKLFMGLSAAVVGKLSENIVLPFREGPLPVFYATAFVYNALLAYSLFALVPFVVMKLTGGELVDGKKKTS